MRSPARRQSVNVILTQSMPVHPLKSEQKLGEHAATGGLRGHRALATVGPISHRATMGHPQRRAKVKVRNWHLPAVSDGGLGRAAIRGTADSRLALHVHASSKMSDICVPIMHWCRHGFPAMISGLLAKPRQRFKTLSKNRCLPTVPTEALRRLWVEPAIRLSVK
jgi:hypothetical protein